MGTYIKKTMPGISYESIFMDCVIFLDEQHKAGDIIGDRIILTDNIWYGDNIPTEEELITAMEEMREKPLKSA